MNKSVESKKNTEKGLEMLLASVFFADLPKKSAEKLIMNSSFMRYNKGEYLIKEGEIGDFACLIIKGTVDICAQGNMIISRGQGELLGEMALLDEDVRSSSVVAAEEVTALILEKEQILKTTFEHPQLYRNIVKILISKLRTSVSQHVDEALKKNNLERFLSPTVVRKIMKDSKDIGEIGFKTEKLNATILFSDIKGFTGLSERLTATEIADLLNKYFTIMTDTVFKYNGTLDKYIGDAVMAVFGAPDSGSDENHALNATKAAIEMIEKFEIFNSALLKRKKFEIRIGINTGEVVAGYLGAPKRMEYSVLGEPVVIACRLESLAEPNNIYIGSETNEMIKDEIETEFIDRIITPKGSNEIDVFKVKL